jgi:chorismate-pyruvate lyase
MLFLPHLKMPAAGLRALWFLCLWAGAILISEPAWAGRQSALTRLESDLRGPLSATQILTERCFQLKFASPPIVRAVRQSDEDLTPSPRTRLLLRVSHSQTVRYRRVQLLCGDHLLSEADNWYVPDRLSADMNRTLDTTQTSFGTVVKPLDFHRRTLQVKTLHDHAHVLRVTALLISRTGVPFSLVVENYSRVLVENARPGP